MSMQQDKDKLGGWRPRGLNEETVEEENIITLENEDEEFSAVSKHIQNSSNNVKTFHPRIQDADMSPYTQPSVFEEEEEQSSSTSNNRVPINSLKDSEYREPFEINCKVKKGAH
jgi:hypothetical protein